MKEDYIRGQEDLIKSIKGSFKDILDDKENGGDMLLVSIVTLLRGLKPIKESNTNSGGVKCSTTV